MLQSMVPASLGQHDLPAHQDRFIQASPFKNLMRFRSMSEMELRQTFKFFLARLVKDRRKGDFQGGIPHDSEIFLPGRYQKKPYTCGQGVQDCLYCQAV